MGFRHYLVRVLAGGRGTQDDGAPMVFRLLAIGRLIRGGLAAGNVGVLVLVVALLIVGCGATVPPTSTPEPVELTFLYYTRTLQSHYEQLKKDFEADNPNVTVNLRQGDQYSAFRGGDAEVFEVGQLAIAVMADRGVIQPLDPFFQGPSGLELGDFYAGSLESLRWGGQVWGLPAGVDPLLLYYNRDIFDAKGVPYPTNDWTWGDMLEAGLRISEPEAEPPLFGFVSEADRWNDFISLAYQNGGGLYDSLVDPTGITLTDEDTIEALEWYADLALQHRVMPTPAELGWVGGMQAAVVSKSAAMWYGNLSERGGDAWQAPWHFNWGAVAPPAGKERRTLLALRAYVINRGAARPALAWEWVRYLALHPAPSYDVPALKAAAQADVLLASDPPEVREAVRVALETGYTLPSVSWLLDFFRPLGRAVDMTLRGSDTPEEALTSAQESVNDALERRKAE